jgi:hypothetical protein
MTVAHIQHLVVPLAVAAVLGVLLRRRRLLVELVAPSTDRSVNTLRCVTSGLGDIHDLCVQESTHGRVATSAGTSSRLVSHRISRSKSRIREQPLRETVTLSAADFKHPLRGLDGEADDIARLIMSQCQIHTAFTLSRCSRRLHAIALEDDRLRGLREESFVAWLSVDPSEGKSVSLFSTSQAILLEEHYDRFRKSGKRHTRVQLDEGARHTYVQMLRPSRSSELIMFVVSGAESVHSVMRLRLPCALISGASDGDQEADAHHHHHHHHHHHQQQHHNQQQQQQQQQRHLSRIVNLGFCVNWYQRERRKLRVLLATSPMLNGEWRLLNHCVWQETGPQVVESGRGGYGVSRALRGDEVDRVDGSDEDGCSEEVVARRDVEQNPEIDGLPFACRMPEAERPVRLILHRCSGGIRVDIKPIRLLTKELRPEHLVPARSSLLTRHDSSMCHATGRTVTRSAEI